ncbi:MAG: MBL fold metallo-hydrolase [Candidatus Heimdallarchaeota archaeon]|nr:MBL fold metallo-hydrolase [Candidatus Heimdallarchaeota archaeon]MDH5646934.1 MBL fold metallo-hydrolase [Candidatus Heimdallarchaeota archaeon]
MSDTIEIHPVDFHYKMQTQNPPLILDLQGEEEYKSWNMFNSVNIPFTTFIEIEDLPKQFHDREIVAVCGTGNKSKVAVEMLQDKGYNIRSLIGGQRNWNNSFDSVKFNIDDTSTEIYQFRRMAKGCISYLIVNDGDAALIDPSIHTDVYLDKIDELGLNLKYILETHLQADHISGARAIADRTGARIMLSANDPFQFEFNSIKNNETFQLGNQPIIRAIETPGHTKGSMSFRIKDLGLLAGDTIFATSFGRPDLANKAEEFANDLYDTIHTKIRRLPRNMFIASSHIGKFVVEHFHQPITTSVGQINNFESIHYNRDHFIDYAVKAATDTPHPPSFSTIVKINQGIVDIDKDEILNLEFGPNRCSLEDEQ